jgi:hypothetical protein
LTALIARKKEKRLFGVIIDEIVGFCNVFGSRKTLGFHAGNFVEKMSRSWNVKLFFEKLEIVRML